MEQKINEENIENNVLTLEKHLRSNQYQDLLFEIRHKRTKYVNFLFRFNFDFGFFKKKKKKHDEADCVSERFRMKE